MKNLMGIDIGTTSLKGCVFDENGNELASVTKSYTLITDGERVEFPAEKYFELFEQAYEELSKKARIDAFAIDTQGETLIFLDKSGNPLMNAIVWLDNRAEKQAKAIEDKFGIKSVYERTGQTEIPAGYPAPKVLWLKEERPELFEKLDKILLLEDYLLYRITGKFVCERSLYASTLYLNVKTGEYWKEMLDFIGIDENYLPTLYESGERVGEYKNAVVCTGALDQISGFIGSGIIEEGTISEMTGTALAVCALAKDVPPYFDGIKVPAYYVGKSKYCLLMWAPTAGMVMEWYKKNFYFDADYDKINEDAEKVPFGSEGLVLSPNMRGSVMPVNDPDLKGGAYGIDLKHTRAHFTRAIMESVACLLRRYLEYLQIPVNEVISIGGGAKSKLWRQIKADITGKKVVTLKNKETGCLGTAILAGYGSGVYKDINEAVSKIVERKDEVTPKAEKAEADTVYNRYLELEELLLQRKTL
ncbi:MAG: hypothetical protein E7343_04130 [Clostridiales bacterium]|nr:hypothetical protein [Clostridiales bacterium]